MDAWLSNDPMNVASYRRVEHPLTTPLAGEVRIAIKAAALRGILYAAGPQAAEPFVPGSGFAGTIAELGDGVTEFAVGQRVYAGGTGGGFASFALAKVETLTWLPNFFPFDDAAVFFHHYPLADYALVNRAKLQEGETLLVAGMADGLGAAAIQIAKQLGAKVIALASNDEKCAAASAVGANATVNYAQAQDPRHAIRTLTDGAGPDVIFDAQYGKLIKPLFETLRQCGRYIVWSTLHDYDLAIPLELIRRKEASMIGSWWNEFRRRDPQGVEAIVAQLVSWYSQGKTLPLIDSRWPMAELPMAIARYSALGIAGAVVVENP